MSGRERKAGQDRNCRKQSACRRSRETETRRKAGIGRWFLMIGLVFLLSPVSVSASEASDPDSYDYSGIQEVLDEASEDPPTFSELAKQFFSGQGKEALSRIPAWLESCFFSELKGGRRLLSQVLLLAAFGAVFSGLSDAFRDKQAGETGFYVTYLLLLSLLFTGFQEAVSAAETVMEQVTAFMGALVPAFTLSVAASGKPLTAVFSYEFILICVNAAQWCFQMLFLPGIQIFAVVSLVGQISKEEMLGKLQELLELVLGWGMKALLGLILGYGAVQSLVLPLADSLKTGAVTRILSAIPGIGNSAGAAAELAAGTANLIKNSMGAAALAALLFLAAVPLLKLLVLALLYQGAAALVQPAADERVTECLSSMGKGMLLLFKLTGGAVCLFFLSVALVCGFTSAGL